MEISSRSTNFDRSPYSSCCELNADGRCVEDNTCSEGATERRTHILLGKSISDRCGDLARVKKTRSAAIHDEDFATDASIRVAVVSVGLRC